jgi:hypothetical protein
VRIFVAGATGAIGSRLTPLSLDDSAAATGVAVERGAPGIYNIVDDRASAGARLARCARREAAPAMSRGGWRGSPPARTSLC